MNAHITERMAEEVVAKFNYSRVHQYMVAVDWKYDPVVLIQDTHSRVPTIKELKMLSRSLMRQAVYNLADANLNHSTVYSGGFLAIATRPVQARDNIRIQLYFTLCRESSNELNVN